MTSNLGSDALLMDPKDEQTVSKRAKESVLAAVRQAFAPEFVNRIDELVRHEYMYIIIIIIK